MPPIHIMIKPVSGACNMRCTYCFYADEAAHRNVFSYGKMDSATVKNIVRKAFIYADESVSFTFQGGEPLLAGLEFFEAFVKCVNSFNTRDLDVLYSLQTNGTLLTDSFCRFFKANDFLVGVSLDGTEEIHDALRKDASGNGSYKKVKDGIRLLEKHGVDFNLLCVLTKECALNIKTVWKELSPHRHVQFIPCIDGLDGTSSPHSIDAELYGKALVDIFDLYERHNLLGSPVSERRIDNYLFILMGYPPEQCGMCGSCGTYFLCEADGSVFPCDFYVLDHWKLGNVNETSFARMERGEVMERFQNEGMQISDACRSCEYYFLCRGGCRRDREPDLLTNRFCESYKYFFENRLERMRELAELLDE